MILSRVENGEIEQVKKQLVAVGSKKKLYGTLEAVCDDLSEGFVIGKSKEWQKVKHTNQVKNEWLVNLRTNL